MKFCGTLILLKMSCLKFFEVHSPEHLCKCSQCNASILGESEANTEFIFTCPLCCKGFSQVSLLKMHICTHIGEKWYKCPHCNKSFNSIVEFRSHVQNHRKANIFKYTYNRPLNVDKYKHVQMHLEKSSTNQSEVGSSLQNDTGHYQLNENFSLLPHYVFLSDFNKLNTIPSTINLDYNSPEHYQFNVGEIKEVKENLSTHPLLNNTSNDIGDMHFSAQVGIQEEQNISALCTKMHKNSKSLQKCLSIHNTNNKLNSQATLKQTQRCFMCSKDFANPGSLKRHKLIHSGKAHKCYYCNKSFAYPSGLKRHILSHSRKEPY